MRVRVRACVCVCVCVRARVCMAHFVKCNKINYACVCLRACVLTYYAAYPKLIVCENACLLAFRAECVSGCASTYCMFVGGWVSLHTSKSARVAACHNVFMRMENRHVSVCVFMHQI